MKINILLIIAFCFITGCIHPVKRVEQQPVTEKISKVIPQKKMVLLIYMPWEYRKLSDITDLFQQYPDLKMVLAFPSNYQHLADTNTEAYKKLLFLIQENKVEIALRLKHEPVLPLIAHTDDADGLLGKRDSLPVPAFSWPEDVRQQIARAREDYFELWGRFPRGLVPAGGWLSKDILKALKGMELEWCVSGPYDKADGPMKVRSGMPEIFFMDRQLVDVMYRSDALLGQRYLAKKIMEIIEEKESNINTIVFDENYYKTTYNKRITPLIEKFADSLSRNTTHVQCIIPEEVTGTFPHQFAKISLKQFPIVSWQYDDFSPWIGEEEENAAWGLLAKAREEVQKYQNSGTADINRLTSALNEIYEAEAGDNFYYFGTDYESVHDVKKEHAFMAGLTNIYRMIGLEPPEELYHSLKEASGYSSIPNVLNDTTMEIGPGYVRWLDVRNDDYGSGDIEYPLPAGEYPKGSYDLAHFGVRYDDDNIYFEVSFLTMMLLHNSPIGLDLPLVDIYMDLNHRIGAGETKALTARNFYIDAKDAWEYCINVNGWGARLYRSYARNNYRQVEVDISAYTTQDKNMVTIQINRKILRGNPLNWGYVVAVMGNDRDTAASPPLPLKVVNNPKKEHVFRGTWAGFAPPPLIDVLTPRGKDQKKILRVYRKRVPVTLHAVRVKG